VRFLVTVSPLTFLYPDLSMACIYTYGWLVFFRFVFSFFFFFSSFIYIYFTYLFSRLIEDFELAYKEDMFSFSIIMIIHAINIE